MFKNIGVFIVLLALSNPEKLPSSFHKCKKGSSNFDECLTKSVEDAIKQLKSPKDEVNLPSMDPLEVSSLEIGAGSGPVSFEQKYKNMKIHGYDKIHVRKANMNFETLTLTLDHDIPEFKMNFDYEVKGRILLLPISGEGPGSIVLENLHNVITFKLEEYEKNGVKYYRATNCTLKMNPKFIKFQLDNLFDGDKLLGDNMNKVMNDNWEEVFTDVKPSYEKAFEDIYLKLINNFLKKVPVSELFD